MAALCLGLVGRTQAQLGARLEQASNGTPEAPVSAVDWVTTTITTQRGHFVEDSSIPYRLVFETLLPGAHRVVIGWDTKTSGRHATDYLTHYNRLTPHNQFGAHNVPEVIQPLRSISGGPQGPSTFPIPSPSPAPTSFQGLPANQRVFHIYNGTITSATYVSEGSLNNAFAESRMAIEFTASQTPVVILFGGHIAAKAERGSGQTAGGVTGLDYRMRVIEADGLPVLASVAVNAPAVVSPPTCNISGADPVCPATTNNYAASTDAMNATITWTLTANTTSAAIIGLGSGPAVQVRSGDRGGSFTLQATITDGPRQSVCERIIMVLTNLSLPPLANASVCPGGTAIFDANPTGTGPFAYVWRKGESALTGQTNRHLVLTNVSLLEAGSYCVQVTGPCNSVTNCAILTVQSNTTATPLASLSRCVGEGTVFSTIPGGVGPFAYRWRKNGVQLSGQTNRILTIPNVVLSDAGTYTVEVTGLCNSVTNSGQLAVHALPPCGIQGPATICPQSGGTGFLAPAGMAEYRWRVTGNGTIVGPTNQQSVMVAAGAPGFLTLNLITVNSNGCSRSCSRTITVGDIQPPVVSCPPNFQTNTQPGQCGATVNFSIGASDDCNVVTVTCNPPSGTQFSKGTTTVNCTAIDTSGNQASCSFTVTVVDLEKPRLSCPTNLIVNTEGGLCEAAVTYNVTISDNCPSTTLTCSPPSGTVFPLGTSTVNCRGSDAAGNVELCRFDVTVLDQEAPQITCSTDLTFVADPEQCDVVVDYNVVATDNCALANVQCVPPSGSLFTVGETTVECVATDLSQNQSRCSFTVKVFDQENPRIVCPANINVSSDPGQCDAQILFTLETSDNCRALTVNCVPSSGSRFAAGQTNVTCTATDSSGNTASCTFKVTVSDNERPVLTCPADILVNTDIGRCDAFVQYSATITDNCPGATLQCVPPSESVFVAGLTKVNCFATDASSNAVSCAFDVTVQDAEPPNLVCLDRIITNSLPGECATVVQYDLSPTDNCPGVETFCDFQSGISFPIGETWVYCIVFDTSGNLRECTFPVIVNDQERPVITCPADLIVNTEVGRCDAVITFAATASDNCAAPTVTCAPPSGTRFVKGTHTVNCTATDTSGNTATCAFRVIVQDHETPTVMCPTNIATNTAPGRCDAVISYAASASDNCPGATLLCLPPSGATFPRGATTVSCVATDASGNTNRCTFTVAVEDRQPPAIVCPPNINTNTEPGRCDRLLTFAATVNDNCPGTTLVCSPPSGSRFVVGETSVTCVATDVSGNTNRCTFSVTVNDSEGPDVICPEDIVTETTPGACDALVNFAATAVDNCPGATVVCIPPSGTHFPRGATVVACTATDTSGNAAACAFTVTVNDNQPPAVSCPSNIVTNAAPGRCDRVVSFVANATDNCPGTTVVCMPPSGTAFSKGATAVTCVTTDASGNTNRCSFTVTVNDNEKPTITCPPSQQLFTAPRTCQVVANFAPTATDNCGSANITCVPPSGSAFNPGVNNVTCTATDAAGNSETCSFTITVRDSEPPALTCPTNIMVAAEFGRCDAVVSFAPTVGDNCPGATVFCNPPSGTRFLRGATPVNCTAADASSNQVTCSFTVTVQDPEAPQLLCPSNVITNTASGRCNRVVEFSASVSDNCGADVVCEPPSGSMFALGTNTVTCTATDTSGNRNTCAFSIAVLDIEPPTIACPADITLNTEPGRCDAVSTFAPNATDNCAVADLSCVPASGSRFNTGVTTVTCTTADTSGNTASCSFSVVVNDAEPPTIVCPANIVLNTEPGRCSARATFSAQFSDNCPGATVSSIPPPGSEFPIGTTTVVCTVTDAAGNARSCAFDVRVVDSEPPRLNCPGDLIVDTEPNECTATVVYSVTGDDACNLTNLVCLPPSGSLFNRGVTLVHCSASDASGNEATCAFNVTVRDTERTMLLCPTNIVVAAAAGRCDTTVDFTPSASDNCDNPTIVCAPTSGSTFPLGTTTVTCTATDSSGNTNQCAFTVRVIDTQRPVLTCPTNMLVNAETGRCDARVFFTASVDDENCGSLSVTCTPPSGSTFPLGTTQVTCSSTDSGGNVGTCAFLITVRDNQSPVIQCPGNLVTDALPGRCDVPLTFNATATDNCSAVAASCFPPSGSSFSVGTTTVTCSATDGSANVGSCQFTVTVRDIESPALQCPSDILVNTATGRCDAVVSFNTQSFDNCSAVTVTCVPPSGASFAKGTNLVTCTARDASSNSNTCTFRIIVRDVDKPQIVCPGDIVVSADTNQCRTRVTFSASAIDNCNGATIACNPPSNSFFNKGVTTVICVATDSSGNTNRCQFTVTVNDTTPPSIVCPANIITNAAPGQNSTVVTFVPFLTDNCPGLTHVCTPQSGSVFQEGTTPVTCTATDSSGNTRSCTFTVSVDDNEPPMIHCPTNIIVATSTGRCDAVAIYNVTATDNSQMVTIVCNPPSGSLLPKGLTNVLCFASDPASNRVSCNFTINVVDLELPVIACSTNMVLSTQTGRCDAPLTYATNATDNCGIASFTCSPPSGALLPKGTNTVSCTATDTSGNTQLCAFTVRVIDSERPVITCPGKLVFNTPPGQCSLTVNYGTSVTDNCPGASVSCSPPSGSSFTKGIATVICTARDASGNTAACNFQVEIHDLQSPSITCPADITTISYPGSCGSSVPYAPTVTDNCPGATISCVPPSGSLIPVGTNVVSCQASDTSGNTAACSFRVIVRDVEGPTITCPGDIIIDGRDGNCTPVATYSPIVRDNCTNIAVNCIPPSGTTFAQGTNRITCSVFDSGGNMNSCTFSIIVRLQPITATPLQSQTRCASESVTFSTSATGPNPITFAWFKDGLLIPGRTNASLALSNLTPADSGTYAVLVQNHCTSVSNSATLTVKSLVTVNGMTNVAKCDCDPLVLSPTVTGTGPFSYVWRKNGSIIPGATGNTLAFAQVKTNDAGLYTVEVSGACNTAATSANVSVIHVPNPAVYTNSGRITIADNTQASPYPSSVRAICVPQAVKRATVTLRGFTHPYPDDVDVLLTAPDGTCVMLMSDTGAGTLANNISITLDDSAEMALPDVTQLFTGTFRPANYDTDSDAFPAPAPDLPPADTLGALAGTDANGFWSLFARDDYQLDSGLINNGWVLRLYWENNPVRISDPRVLPNGAFQMTVTGDIKTTVIIQASPDLRNWTPIGNLILTAPQTDFTDHNPSSPRFYRTLRP